MTLKRIGFAYNPTSDAALELRERASGWCRLRGEGRVFRTDRIRHAVLLDETAPYHSFEELKCKIPDDVVVRALNLA